MRIKRVEGGDVETTMAGFRKATSIGAALTGLGGHLFIIDDPIKAVDAQSDALRNSVNDWFSSTLLSRLDNKATGAIIVVMQRVHLDDLTGHVLEKGGDWTVLNLPAIADVDEQVPIGDGLFHLRCAGEALHPEYESVAILEGLRKEMGSDDFAAQYQQSPVPPGGAMIKSEWIRYYETLPERTYGTKIIQSWDTAAKDGAHNDWSVCTTWMIHEGVYYLLDLTRGRYEYPRLRETAIALAKRHKPHVILIENASTGIALEQEMRKAMIAPVQLIKPEHNKQGRLYVQEYKFESGRVQFPKNAPFLPELLRELLAFPMSRTDDQVDSISQALAYEPKFLSYANW
jgi:predicted phage terminase large subunit-like protein